jgi:predicted TIM-barrel fold metal-dependent hydrolase
VPDFKLISADSHMNEVDATWARVQKKHGERAPRVVWNPSPQEVGPYLVVKGWKTSMVRSDRESCANEYLGYVIGGLGTGGTGAGEMPSLEASAVGRTSGQADEFRRKFRFEDYPGPGMDPAARLEDQDRDGVEAEVLYSSHLRHFYEMSAEDEPFIHDCCESYNEWLMEFCSHNPKRLVGLPVLSVLDPDGAAADIRKYARRGAKGFMMASSVPVGMSYGDKRFDPIWQAAVECDVPLAMHATTGRWKQQNFGSEHGRHFIGGQVEVEISLGEMIYSAVFDRFPKLKIVSGEFDIGWVGYLVQRTEGFNPKLGLKLAVSEYLRRNVWFTFQIDRTGLLTTPYFGEDNYLWASDFPHGVTLWPDSPKIVDITMRELKPEAKRKIARDNTVKLYKLDL